MNALRYLPFVKRGLSRRGPPLHLTLFVTGVCNARCRHCFHWQEVAAGVKGPDAAQVDQLAASAARMGPLLWVSFGGGEPMLRKDLPQLAKSFGARGLRHLAIPTNGLVEPHQHQLVDEILDQNKDLYLSVSVSFDGPPDVHDKIRQVKDGHARSMASVRAYKQQAADRPNLGVGVIVTVSAENQDVLPQHLEQLVDELRPDNVTINLARGDALDRSLLDVSVSRYREVVAVKERLMREGRLPYFDFPMARLAVARDRQMYEHVAAVAEGGSHPHLPCTAGSLSAVIFENGEVHPCEMLGQHLGNLNDVGWDLQRLWNERPAQALRKQIKDTNCECTWECAQADNVLFAPGRWPSLALQALAVARPQRPSAPSPSLP